MKTESANASQGHALQITLENQNMPATLPSTIDVLERELMQRPDDTGLLAQLAGLHETAGHAVVAARYRCRAFLLPPLEGKSWEMLAKAAYFLGRFEVAADFHRAWLQDEPGHPLATHLLAACSQHDVPARASDAFLAMHFDDFAPRFDANLLDHLAYRGPRMIGDGLAMVAVPGARLDAVDIGCGTGLCGPVIAACCRSIVGVDLSAGMLEQAAARGVYSSLEKAEAGDYLARHPACCDLLVAADTLIYFGDLGPLFQGVARALRPGGHFIFTIETLPPSDDASSGFRLDASGRYRHHRSAVEAQLGAHGLQLLFVREERLREERGEAVAGLLFVARVG